MFVVAGSGMYLARGGNVAWKAVEDLCDADMYDTREQANKALLNSTKKLRNKYGFKVVDVSSFEEFGTTIDNDSSNQFDLDVLTASNELKDIANKIMIRREHLTRELSLIDLEIQDIEHAAEFYELNASQGYKLYKMLHDARIKRRNIKDEWSMLGAFLNSSIKNMDNVRKMSDGLDNRQYTPRVNKELFGV